MLQTRQGIAHLDLASLSHRWGRALVAAVLALLALATVGAASAAAAPAWLSPEDLSASGHNAYEPQVAVDPQGDAVAVWRRFDGSKHIIQSATRPVGGSWSAAADLSAPGENASEPQVAVDPQGVAVAVWRRSDGTNYIVQSATRPAGGSWSPVTELSKAGEDAEHPQVAVDPQGDAVAVWSRSNGTNSIVQSATRPAGGGWSEATDLSASEQNAEYPQVAVDSQGDAVAIWLRYDGGHNIVQTATRPAGGSWSPVTELSKAGEDAEHPQVAVDPQGDAVAVWSRSNGTNSIVQSATRPAGGSWPAAADLSAPGYDAYLPQVAVDPQGNAVAVWEREDGSNWIIQSATRPADGSWSAATDLSKPGQNALAPQVAVDPQGNAVAVWERSDGSNWIVQSARRPAGGSWSAATDLSGVEQNAEYPQVAVDSQGNAVTVWDLEEAGSNQIIQAAGYDGAGPQLRSLSIPASGTAGEPLSFSVSPFDVWSALGATSWSFGDGGSASAAAATHAYAAAGTYQVTVTAADALGNATSATGTVTVAAAPTTVTAAGGGRAFAARLARRKGNKVLLRLRCRGAGRCRGAVKLYFRRKLIAKRRFGIARGKAKTLRVKLNGRGRTLVRRTHSSHLKLKLRGRDVKNRVVVLKGL